MGWAGYFAAGAAGYFLGSIPTGYLVARARGVDIRAHGSGNIGATNAFRVLGKTWGGLVLAADAAKGVVAVRCAGWLGLSDAGDLAGITAGVAAILGHNYTCWLRFKGGKGVATTAGVMGALAPAALATAVAAWLLVVLTVRIVSAASIASAVTLPIAAWFFTASRPVRFFALFGGALAIVRHRANIGRLLAGTEPRIGASKPAAAKTSAPPAP